MSDTLNEYMHHESYRSKIKAAFSEISLSGRREQLKGLAIRYKLDGHDSAVDEIVHSIDAQQTSHDSSAKETERQYFSYTDVNMFKSCLNTMSNSDLETAAKRSDERRDAAYGLESIMSVVNCYNSTIIQEREMALLKEYGNAEYKDSAHADVTHRLSAIRSDLDELARSAGYIDNEGQFDKDALAENIMKANISSELAYDVADYTADIFNDNRSEDRFAEEEGFDHA